MAPNPLHNSYDANSTASVRLSFHGESPSFRTQDRKENWRVGLALVLPVNRYISIKISEASARVPVQEPPLACLESYGNIAGREDRGPKSFR